MNAFKLITTVALAAAIFISVMPTSVSADSMEQEQELEQEISCQTQGYGTSTCSAKQKSRQKQKMEVIYRADGTAITKHRPENTGLDLPTTAAASTLVLGSLAAAVKLNKRK
ncbi:MAG: hypothetical protein M3Q81_01620 [bacterium]|nr:hypothetical protein [bacterium]